MPEEQGEIYQISSTVLGWKWFVEIVQAGTASLFWSREWSPQFYVKLAKLGFITTAYELEDPGSDSPPPAIVPILLPEIQKEYAVLDWQERHIGRTLRRWMKSQLCQRASYRLVVGCDLAEIVRGIRQSHQPCWLIPEYEQLLESLLQDSGDESFELLPIGLEADGGAIVAGEVGYRIGRTYTSLTGFMDRSDPSHNHAGKLQLHLLAEHLEASNYAFWNLGHPGMQYKLDLGARVLKRADFLMRWQTAAQEPL